MAEIHPIYSHSDYRAYLGETLASERFGRGARRKLAEFLNCQSSFISLVLSGRSEISLEHAFRVNKFFEHGRDEAHYFMNLVQLGRAGSYELEAYYQSVLTDIRNKKLQVSEVLKTHEISPGDVLDLYGNWYCISIYMLVSIPKYQDPRTLQEKIDASDEEFQEALDFLFRTGLVEPDGGKLKTGQSRVFMKKSSPYAQAATLLIRQRVIEKINLKDPESINYSQYFTIPSRAYPELKKKILKLVAELDEMIELEGSEEFCTLTLDLLKH